MTTERRAWLYLLIAFAVWIAFGAGTIACVWALSVPYAPVCWPLIGATVLGYAAGACQVFFHILSRGLRDARLYVAGGPPGPRPKPKPRWARPIPDAELWGGRLPETPQLDTPPPDQEPPEPPSIHLRFTHSSEPIVHLGRSLDPDASGPAFVRLDGGDR